MNSYKKIIRNKDFRLKILEFLKFVPDRIMIPLQYRIKTGRTLNLSNPQRYTEKIQWYKLNYRTDLMTQCSDKYEVRSFVENRECGEILNKLYAVYDNANDITFETLPKSFAMKMTVGSGMNYFVTDKEIVNIDELRSMAKKWFATDSSSYGREWSYYNIKPRIVFEELLPLDCNNDLPDYKFFCFNGEPYCLYTMIDYRLNHDNGKLGFFDMNFNLLPYYRKDFAPIKEKLNKPFNFDMMIEYARKLSKGFPHVRVDFYNINGKIIFGELTFYNASGYTLFEPDEFDFILGEKFVLPNS